jgi:hypothetical protein
MPRTKASSEWRRARLIWGLGFFVFGATIHTLLLRNYHRRWPAISPEGQALWSHPITYVAMAFCGGACVTWMMLRLLRKTAAGEIAGWHVLLRGAGSGIAASALAYEFFFVAFSLESVAQNRGTLVALPYLIMGFSTYGGGEVINAMPYAALYGAAAGALCSWKRLHSLARASVPTSNLSTDSLVFGILGVVLLFTVPLGMIIGPVAVLFGARAIRAARREGRRPEFRTIVGTLLGGIVVAYDIYVFLYSPLTRLFH